jgi:hypothetical protein
MKLAWIIAALVLLAGPTAVQAQVSVVVGVNVPPVHGTVIIGAPYPRRHPVIVAAPRYRYYPSRGVVVVRRGPPYGRGHGHGHGHGYGHRHHRHSRWH